MTHPERLRDEELEEIRRHCRAYHDREFPWPYVDRLLQEIDRLRRNERYLRGQVTLQGAMELEQENRRLREVLERIDREEKPSEA